MLRSRRVTLLIAPMLICVRNDDLPMLSPYTLGVVAAATCKVSTASVHMLGECMTAPVHRFPFCVAHGCPVCLEEFDSSCSKLVMHAIVGCGHTMRKWIQRLEILHADRSLRYNAVTSKLCDSVYIHAHLHCTNNY